MGGLSGLLPGRFWERSLIAPGMLPLPGSVTTTTLPDTCDGGRPIRLPVTTMTSGRVAFCSASNWALGIGPATAATLSPGMDSSGAMNLDGTGDTSSGLREITTPPSWYR